MLAGGECRFFLQLFNSSTVNSLLTTTPLSDHFVKNRFAQSLKRGGLLREKSKQGNIE